MDVFGLCSVVVLLLCAMHTQARSVRSVCITPCEADLGSSFGTITPTPFRHDGLPYMPDKDGDKEVLELDPGKWVEMTCLGKKNQVTYTSYTGSSPVANLSCSSEGKFLVDGEDVSLSTLSCEAKQKETIVTEGNCGPANAFKLLDIGFNVETKPQRRVSKIKVCFDDTHKDTLYTSHTIYGEGIDGKFVDSDRPGFKKGTFYRGMDCYGFYSKDGQTERLTALMGDAQLAAQYIDESKSNYLAKGHLSPDADFIYGPFQDATYYFINVAPQWQSFNNGNWKALEIAIRDYAIAKEAVVNVYTGTHDKLALKDGNQNDVVISLTDEKLHAPLYYWKVIFNTHDQTAMAFVGVNNPYLTAEEVQDHELCTNVCGQVSWVDWGITELSKGFMYCCDVNELKSKISSLPDLGTYSLLNE